MLEMQFISKSKRRITDEPSRQTTKDIDLKRVCAGQPAATLRGVRKA
jgi:hypothetical protein